MANVKKVLFNIGLNDYEYPIQSNGVMLSSYAKWKSMLQRCYSEKYVDRRKCYVGCSVCEECMERDKNQPATELFIRINGMKMEVTKMVNESERMLQRADIDQFGSLSKYVRPYLGY